MQKIRQGRDHLVAADVAVGVVVAVAVAVAVAVGVGVAVVVAAFVPPRSATERCD